MRKLLVFAAIVVAFALGMLWANRTETKQVAVAAPTKIEAPAQSVAELKARYAEVKLTPAQQRLVAAGLSPTATYSVTIKTK